MIGSSLGPYKVLEQIGAGGMGEVYLGEDTRLGRKVAIKVLPQQFASIPERLTRFEQEARAAAALNHPHIAVVHDIGFEQGEGGAAGTHYMVQEYLEGRTLRAARAGGRLPLAQALTLATEITEALAVAHDAGIVHRDLKPDNVFVSPDGHAKVLDFGLAKLVEIEPATGSASGSGETATAMAQGSPTPSPMGTAAGQVMGTVGYMAPEQVNGEPVDGRADIFAFGCVLYELASGRQPFAGRSMLQTLDKIVHDEPPALDEIDADLPLRLQWILEKCLAKDPRGRYQHAADLAVDLRNLRAEVESGTAASLSGAFPAGGAGARRGETDSAASAQRPAFTGATRFASLLLVALALLIGWQAASRFSRSGAPGGGPTMRFSIEVPPDLNLTSAGRVQLALSRDGRSLVFVANDQLWLRALDDEVATPIRGTENGGRAPFFSPDGRHVGFWSDGQLKRVSIDGGTPTTLTPAVNLYGAYWSTDRTIFYGQGGDGIWRVSENGGEPELVVATAEGERLQHPWLLPGGEALLYARRPSGVGVWDDAEIVVHSFADGTQTVVHTGGTDPRYLESGHLLFGRGGVLWAIAFDPVTAQTSGGVTPVREGIRPTASGAQTGALHWALADNGTIVYLPGAANSTDDLTLVWMDPDGGVEAVGTLAGGDEPRVSPSGRYVALEGITDDYGEGIWIIDAQRGDSTLLTTEGDGSNPLWAPDGEYVYFVSTRDGGGIWRKRADFSRAAEHVWPIEATGAYLTSISADGTRLLYTRLLEATGVAGGEIWLLELGDEPTATEILASPDYIYGVAVFHPTGRWIAYDSFESGEAEIYVREIAEDGTLGARRTISTDGGVEPAWSRDGSVLYYIRPPSLMAVEIEVAPEFAAGRPRVAAPNFTGQIFGRPSGSVEYDLGSDGRVLALTDTLVGRGGDPASSTEPPRNDIKVIVNWFEELAGILPGGR